MDVLRTEAPGFSPAEALGVLAGTYGVVADLATPLGSERDQIFRVDDSTVGPVVLKISNRAERMATLDMETLAMRHLREVDPELPIPRVINTLGSEPIGTVVDGRERAHLVRLITALPGRHAEGEPISTRFAERMGAVCARVSVGLQGFFHADAGRQIDWDIRRTRQRERVGAALESTRALPSGVQHGDLTLTNVLREGGDIITGVIDFGDMHHTAAVCDLAASLTSILRNTSGTQEASAFELAAAFLDGYQRIRPLSPAEAESIGHLVLARVLTTLDISRERAAQHPDNTSYITQYDTSNARLLATLTELSDVELGDKFSRLAGMPSRVSGGDLRERRAKALGGRLAPTFFREPLLIEAGEGAWLIDADGERYLDAYNNVAVAGHSHPAINQAVTRQLRTLNTSSRYLHPQIVALAERLTASMPPGLDTCVFVTSGSEAVELAWRMASAHTGATGTIVAEWAYHGISARTHDFSPNDWSPGHAPTDVALFTAPHAGPTLDRAEADRRVGKATEELAERGFRPGILMVDPQFTSEGILDAPPDFMAGLVAGIHDRGGLFLADEVQSGFGRSGPQLWRFAALGITPDLVTLGKPMGAGLPVAAVVTRREIADSFNHEYFSTFAGSPVSCAAASAVLDVLEDRRIPERAVEVGKYLRERLTELSRRFPAIVAVRGYGLIAGVELTGGRDFAVAVVEGLRERRILAGNTGRGGNVLKVRPPLVWQREHVDLLVENLADVLVSLG